MYPVTLEKALFPEQTDHPVIDKTVGQLLRETAAAHGEAPAILEVGMSGETGREWSYADLLRDAEELARAMATRFEKGERIVVWAPNTPEWIILEYACALAGLTLVTANPAYQARELAYVLKQSRAAALFLVREYRGNPMAEIAAEAVKDAPNVREVVDTEDPAQMLARGDRPDALPEVTPDDEAMVQYTSGTTGFPKGACLSHRGLVTNANHFMVRAEVGHGEVVCSYMPMFHTSGCGMCVLGAVQRAAKVVQFRIFDPHAVLDRTEADRIAFMFGVPTMLVALLEANEVKTRDTSSVRVAVSGGSMVAPELVKRITETFGCDFQIVYGQTETCPLICEHQSTDSFEDKTSTIGQPMPRMSVAIRRVEDGAVADVGEVGEICVRGYNVMLGYNDNPEATAAAIDGDGWLRTGDLGTMDARGYLRITGRVKEMIIRGGENLFPAEIENRLLEHPAVAEVAVVGLPDDKWGEIVAAAIRPAPGAALDPEELKAHVRAALAPMKTPVAWHHAEAFPLTGSGKIQKFAVREAIVAGELPSL
ncbi:MAG: AMP-binding protein [Pseudomonadota bacterium]